MRMCMWVFAFAFAHKLVIVLLLPSFALLQNQNHRGETSAHRNVRLPLLEYLIFQYVYYVIEQLVVSKSIKSGIEYGLMFYLR